MGAAVSTPKHFSLDALLSAYGSPKVLSRATFDACRKAEGSTDPAFQRVFVRHVATRLSGPTPPTDRALRQAFLRRLHTAVYFGGTVSGWFDVGALKPAMGTIPRPLGNADDQALRMVVGGRVWVDPAYLPTPVFKVSVVSLYAPNLETTATSDYAHLANPRFNAHLYVSIMRATLDAAVKLAATDLHCTAVALPAVGLGAYARMIPREHLPSLARSLVDSFVAACHKYHIRPFVFAYGRDSVAREVAAAAAVHNIDATAGGGNLFMAPALANAYGCKDVALINAWDTRSLIGNGLSRDATIDGFMASGCGPGAALPNSTFYHNVVVMREALADDGGPAEPQVPLEPTHLPALLPGDGRGGAHASRRRPERRHYPAAGFGAAALPPHGAVGGRREPQPWQEPSKASPGTTTGASRWQDTTLMRRGGGVSPPVPAWQGSGAPLPRHGGLPSASTPVDVGLDTAWTATSADYGKGSAPSPSHDRGGTTRDCLGGLSDACNCGGLFTPWGGPY